MPPLVIPYVQQSFFFFISFVIFYSPKLLSYLNNYRFNSYGLTVNIASSNLMKPNHVRNQKMLMLSLWLQPINLVKHLMFPLRMRLVKNGSTAVFPAIVKAVCTVLLLLVKLLTTPQLPDKIPHL